MGTTMKVAVLALAASLAIGVSGCEKSRDEMRPDPDTVQSGAHGLQSRDLREMTGRMAPDLLLIPEIVQNPTRITVVVKGVQNKTETEQGRNFDIYVARLAGLLNDSNARDRILFLAERKDLHRMQAEELGNPDTFEDASRGKAPPDPTIKPQFFLYGEFYSMDDGRGTYYLCKFNLTSMPTGAIVWSKQYETKSLN